MSKVARVIHLEISFGPAVPEAQVSLIKEALHAEAKKLTEGIEDKSIMSLIGVVDEDQKHLVRHLS